jgi:hypothetical protein
MWRPLTIGRPVTPSGRADVGESGLTVNQVFILGGSNPSARTQDSVSEWSGTGLQNQLRRFESGQSLYRCPLWTLTP